jgi:SsrA-binding protein
VKTIIENRKVRFDYFIVETYLAGICLIGSEIKSVRSGKVSTNSSYCYFKDDELFVKNLYIEENKNSFNHDPNRDKKLLLKKSELQKLHKKLIKGHTILLTKVVINDKGLVKCEIVLGVGKKNWDKRSTLKERDLERTKNLVD